MSNALRLFLCFVLLLPALLLSSGCGGADSFLVTGLTDPATELDQLPANTPHCTIVVARYNAKPETTTMPLQKGTRIQDALKHVKAPTRFRRMDVKLIRFVKKDNGTTERAKLGVNYDAGKHHVSFETDYDLHPNDRIIIKENPNSELDDMVQAVAGPFGGILDR
jgi:hypothetical protein